MQPPPRKGNYSKFLKNLHTEQLAKLHLKNQHECELLEDIRNFTLKRSAIEKSYSEALLKISSAYLNKKIPNIPDIKIEGATEEKWNMWSVWRTVLEENEKLARARLAAIEVFQQQIADESKVLRDYKVQVSKKSVNQLANIQKEVQVSVQDVDRHKKSYFDEEHCAHDVRDKARDIEEKLKKKKGSFFQSITSLQKNSARVTSRKEQLEEKSSGARNDYILSLATANAHQNRYFTVDLQTAMATMENYVYERVADYLTLMGRTELLTCSATQHSFGKIRDQAQQLTREYNLQCCYLFYPVLKQHIQYDFEPCDEDNVRKITVEHDSSAAYLSQQAKAIAARIVRQNNIVRDTGRKLATCIALRDSGQRVDPNDPNGPDLETKMDEFREQVRRAETEKVKAEASFECLRIGGINVDEWLQEAETLGTHEITRSASSLSMRTDISGQGENPSSDSFYDSDNAEPDVQSAQIAIQQEDDDSSQMDSVQDSTDVDAVVEQERQKIEDLTVGWDDPTQVDWGAAEAAAEGPKMVTPAAQTGPIFKCTALYSYTAQNPDELTIVENEQLEVIGEGDGDGWLRARNYRGEEGYVPHNYLDVERDNAIDSSSQAQLQSQISFSSVDYTVDNDEQDGYQDSVQSPDQVSVISAPLKKPECTQLYCIALYDYDATAEDELTFEEGQIMKIINKSAHGIDDGWWEGELDGRIGNFPSLVVEECDEHGEPLTEPEEESPPPSAPPLMTPPAGPPPSDRFDLDLNINNSFNQPTVDIQVVEVKVMEPNTPKQPAKLTEKTLGSEFSLGVAQIIVTAATPMGEEKGKEFPPVDNGKQKQEQPQKEQHQKEQQQQQQVQQQQQQQQQQHHTMDDDDHGIIIEQPEEEEAEENAMLADSFDDFDDDEDGFEPPSMPPPPLPPSQTSAKGVTIIKPIPPPKKDPFAGAENEKTDAEKPAADSQEVASHEHFFEANFDEAFQYDPDAPKIVTGGRASIPDELAPHQLARLQDLKESNA